MDPMMKVAGVGAALPVIALVLLYGPVVAGFVVAGMACLLMLGVMFVQGSQAIAVWWRGEHWTPFHRRVKS